VLCDYGLAFHIVGADFTSVKTAGSCRWTAPEIVNLFDEEAEAELVAADEKDLHAVLYMKQNDIYAFGMLISEVLMVITLP
jgi:hypothetical protein